MKINHLTLIGNIIVVVTALILPIAYIHLKTDIIIPGYPGQNEDWLSPSLISLILGIVPGSPLYGNLPGMGAIFSVLTGNPVGLCNVEIHGFIFLLPESLFILGGLLGIGGYKSQKTGLKVSSGVFGLIGVVIILCLLSFYYQHNLRFICSSSSPFTVVPSIGLYTALTGSIFSLIGAACGDPSHAKVPHRFIKFFVLGSITSGQGTFFMLFGLTSSNPYMFSAGLFTIVLGSALLFVWPIKKKGLNFPTLSP